MTYYQKETLTAREAQRGTLETIKRLAEYLTGTTDKVEELRDYCELYLDAAKNEKYYGEKWAKEIDEKMAAQEAAEKEAAKAETEVNE